MTLHFSEQDALFHSTEEIKVDDKGLPHLCGEIRLKLMGAEAGWMADILRSDPGRIINGGKSTLGQVGVDTQIDFDQAVLEQNQLTAPASIKAFGNEKWLQMAQLNPVEVGKIGMKSEDHTPFNKNQVLDLIRSGLVKLPKRYPQQRLISEDGQVPLKLVKGVEWVLPPDLTEAEIAAIYRDGRIALRKMQGILPAHLVKDNLEAGEMFVGGIPVSLVGVTAMVGDAVQGVVKHLEARRLDGERTTGTLGYNNRTKLVHVELANLGETPVAKSSIEVPLTFHEPGSPSPLKGQFQGWSKDKQRRVHLEGMSLSDVLDFTDEDFHLMFERLRGQTHSVVIRKQGMVSVGTTDIYDWQKKAELRALNATEFDKTSGGFRKIQEGLRPTHEQGAVLVTRALGTISHLQALYDQGVRHIFFENMNMCREHHESDQPVSGRGDLYLDSGKHMKMIDLERKGMKFYWRPKLGNGDEMAMREFYRGAFILPDEANKDLVDRVSYRGASIAMFGSSVDEGQDNALEQEITDFVGKLGQTFKGDLGIMHGNGPSVMAMADRAARKHGLLSIGMGMDFEQVGEIPNFTPQQLLFFRDNEIEYRQTDFERRQTVPVFNLGGKGTYYELILSFLKTGLKTSLPVPIVLVDPTGTNFWQPTVEQVHNMAQRQIGKYNFERPLTQTWTERVFQPVTDYTEAAAVIEAFHKDPEAFWQQIGISEAELMKAFAGQLALYASVNQGIPRFLMPSFKKRGLI